MTSARRLLLVVAHPDDETFGSGSLLAHAAARGVETVVCCATRGERGEPAPGSGIERHELPAARERELLAAASLLGVSRVEILGLGDSGMDGPPPPGALAATPLDDVTAAVAELIDDVRPEVVVTLDGTDGHRDHIHIRDATLRAVERTSVKPRVYLQCLARSLMDRWVEALRDRDPAAAYLAVGQLGTPDHEITTVLDTAAYEHVRRQAIALHGSQVPPFAVMAPELAREFLTVDRLRRARPPWDGGPLETDIFPTALEAIR
ncbi:MAG: PIG-L family deacetylase [Actinomycetota bacterium]|nr:PIG-L family deacetylase [Actinomycetota bacterium]